MTSCDQGSHIFLRETNDNLLWQDDCSSSWNFLGLEMCHWMVNRGVRKLVVTSRSGIKTGYQNWKINRFKEEGCIVQISTSDVCYYDQTEKLFEDAHKLGPIGGIFHLAAVRFHRKLVLI